MRIHLTFLILIALMIFVCCNLKVAREAFPVYEGEDLGVSWTPEATLFKVWAPTADELLVRIYSEGQGGVALLTLQMNKESQGVWSHELKGDWKNHFYTFQARIGEDWNNEVPDPGAKAVGINGNRGMIIDFSETDPEGWEHDLRPYLSSYAEIVIWEIHMRDFSIHPSAGSNYPGKFLAFTERGTKSPEGLSTMVDHLIELGITHVHLLPSFDFSTVDETRLDKPQYNWGYDPKNYNVPEGSYSTDPYDGRVRIREFKQMVQALHAAGIRVIMDVVYNHMFDADASPFEQLVPGYYFRRWDDGSYSNGAYCGNETASEKPMMRKFIIESLKHWVNQYRVDGFRFDLMGLHDIETMNLIRSEMDKIDPDIFLYGEGWTANETPLPPEKRAVKAHAAMLDRIAVFSDDIRDAIRGHWYDEKDKGFMVGKTGLKESIKFGVVASTMHPQVDYEDVNYSDAPYADQPLKTITYVTCHDNPVLIDKTRFTCLDCSEQDMIDIQKFANAIVLTSQGIPFLHAGEELVRTKFGENNSYNLPDHINQLVWSNKAKYNDVFLFYRDLIALRKNHPAFRMPDANLIRKHLHFFDLEHPLLVGFRIDEHANGDSWKNILVFYNADSDEQKVHLPEGYWRVVATKFEVNEKGVNTRGYTQLLKDEVHIPLRSIMILVDGEST